MPRFAPLAVALALFLVAAACGGSGTSSTDAGSTTTTDAPSRPATTEPGGAPETTIDTVTAQVQARIDELIIEAQQLRGLTFLEPVEVLLLEDADYQERITQLIDEELTDEEVDAETALFRLLGIIAPDADLRDTYDTLYSTGTGGFYEPDTGELVVRVDGEELGPQSEAVVIHELTHALQDQHFSLLDDSEDLEGDEAYVATAVIEGDALLRELTYIENLGSSAQAKWLSEYTESLAEVEAIQADLPGYLVNSLQAPYLDGFFFHQRVGLDGIDALFDDPPESSEQLLLHDKYLEDQQPVEVVLPDFELDGYGIYLEAIMGQKDLELLLGEAINARDAEVASVGWGGDRLRVYTKGNDEAVFVLSYTGESNADTSELAAAFSDFEETMVPSGSFSLIETDGVDLTVIFASDSALGSQLQEAFVG